MTAVQWDPSAYKRRTGERQRPFLELLARVGADHPSFVVDLGCGPGPLTAALADRWPEARVLGVDSSPEMVAEAQQYARPPQLTFEQGDASAWIPDAPVDVLVANALLQWVPGHERLLAHFVDIIASGGWFAFQVPGNFDAPSHQLLAELRTSPEWRDRLGENAVRTASVMEPAGYLERLAALGCEVDAWETTYLHVLDGEDPVLRWMDGTALRPVLTGLSDDPEARDRFIRQLADRLRDAYPQRPFGTVFSFRRIFVVAHKP